MTHEPNRQFEFTGLGSRSHRGSDTLADRGVAVHISGYHRRKMDKLDTVTVDRADIPGTNIEVRTMDRVIFRNLNGKTKQTKIPQKLNDIGKRRKHQRLGLLSCFVGMALF